VDSEEDTLTNPQKNKPRELLNLDVREVSLVDRPAIRRKFLVVKRDDTPNEECDTMPIDELPETTQESLDLEDISKTDESQELQPDTEPELMSVVKEEDLEEEGEPEKGSPKKRKAKAVAEAKEELENESEEDEEPSTTKQKVKKETLKMVEPTSIPVSFSKRDDGSYDLTGVPDEMQATVEEICKQHDAAIQKAAELEEILKAERDERLRRDFVEKAEKEYANLPGTPVELGLLLKSLNDLDSDVAEKVEDVFKSVNAQLESGDILAEVGSAAVEAETTAWGRIEKQAADMVAEGTVSSKAAAISKVLELNPKLYSEYLKEGGN